MGDVKDWAKDFAKRTAQKWEQDPNQATKDLVLETFSDLI